MNKILMSLSATAAIATLALSAAPALASTPSFLLAAPNSGESVDSFDPQVQIFNRAEIRDLDHARAVQIVRFDTAWSDGGDADKAFNAMESSDQAIHLLRENLRADPAAIRRLIEIVRAARALARDAAAGSIDPDSITEEMLSERLYTADCPDPDLLIRTSGEQRISNFLLWQLAYAELYMTPVLWPDFTRAELFKAIAEFQRRDRRYGRVTA